MAINRRALMGDMGQRPGIINARGVRSITRKDSIALTKSLQSINNNLVSINKLLQKNALDQSKKQEEGVRKKRIEEESLRREKKESGLEKRYGKSLLTGVGGALGKLKDTLVNTSKGILSKIFDIAKPFITFFTLGFVGWFSGKVVKWFEDNKEDRKKKIKSFIPKILSALTVAGGVLLAIQFGIPVIMGLIGTIVGMIPVVVGALLNPATWVGLLAAGTAILGIEAAGNIAEFFDRGQRIQKRIRTLSGAKETTAESLGLQVEELDFGRGSDKFYKIGDKYYRKENIDQIISGTRQEGTLAYFKEKGGRASVAGTEEFTSENLRRGKALAGASKEFIEQGIKQQLAAAGKAFGEKLYNYDKMKLDIKQKEDRIAAGGLTADQEKTLRKEIKDIKEKNIPPILEEMEKRSQEYQRIYKTLSASSKKQLADVGVTGASLMTGDNILTQTETMYQAGRAGNKIRSSIMNVADPYLQQATSVLTNMKFDIGAKIDSLFDGGSKVDVNLNVKQTLPPGIGDDDPTEIPVPSAISPYDLTSPWIQFAPKIYGIAAVGI